MKRWTLHVKIYATSVCDIAHGDEPVPVQAAQQRWAARQGCWQEGQGRLLCGCRPSSIQSVTLRVPERSPENMYWPSTVRLKTPALWPSPLAAFNIVCHTGQQTAAHRHSWTNHVESLGSALQAHWLQHMGTASCHETGNKRPVQLLLLLLLPPRCYCRFAIGCFTAELLAPANSTSPSSCSCCCCSCCSCCCWCC